MNKKIIKISLSILLISLMVLSIILINKSKGKTALEGGNITIIINNINDEIVDVKRVEYKKGDTLYKLIDDNYNIKSKNMSAGRVILSINNIETDFTNNWFWIEIGYLNDGKSYTDTINTNDYNISSSTKGVDFIELSDNMIIAFNERDNMTNTSITNKGIISINDDITNDNANKISYIKIIGIILLSLVVLTFVITFIILIKKDKSILTVKKLCILSFMTIILFASEEILTFLPNIQLTFLLITVYTCVFGFRDTTLIILIHVLLDNMLMGSMTPLVILPMFVGYIILAILIYLNRNRHLYIKVIIGAIGGIIYSLLFLITNALFLNISIYHYFIMDIPFEILLVLCNILTIMWLYNPLYKKLNELYIKSV